MDNTNLPPNETAPIFYIGQHDTQRLDPVSPDQLSQAQDLGYDFITTTISTSAFHSRVVAQVKDHAQSTTGSEFKPSPVVAGLHPEDSALQPQDSNNALVGVVSPWIDLGSSDPTIASISRQVLNLEVAYAAFCGINNLILHGPSCLANAVRFGRDVREALGLGPYLQLHVLLPMNGDLEQDSGDLEHLSEFAVEPDIELDEDESEGQSLFDSWEIWNTLRTVCNYSQKLSISLELPRQLPAVKLQSRWYSEPVRLLTFPRTSFLRNAKGYPVLSKQHQQLLTRFARFRFPPWMLLSDVGSTGLPSADSKHHQDAEPTPAEASSKAKSKPDNPIAHLQYLRHVQQSQPPRPPIEAFGRGYEDYLQSPLQPLTDNLESITYEGFEKDPVKYEWYERAIASALKDLASSAASSTEIIVAVAGAGRGPLVTRALRASNSTGVRIQCWAVEKNPNALLLLQRRNITDMLWNGQVQVVKSDMRHWTGPKLADGERGKVDILVSELLGSFADNELSPECLDGVQHVLHPDHGISIPQSYSAHLTPIATPRLYGDLLGRSGAERWELPYVVMLHQYDYLCVQPRSDSQRIPEVKEAWSFSHPVPSSILEHSRSRAGGSRDAGGWAGGDGSNEHNVRACTVNFSSQAAGVCHGLAGYFEAVLYAGKGEKTEISTNPVTMEVKSKDMISWFPIFFPLKTPMHIPETSEIVVSMWRQTDDRSVWYEWLVEVFEGKEGGMRRRRIAISELHSSRKNACLT